MKQGDVVQLKSGGPLMTIESIDSNDNVVCVWYDEKEEIKKGVVKQITLKIHDSSSTPPVAKNVKGDYW